MDGPWVVYFQNCVRWPRPPSMMAAMNRHSFNIHCKTLWDLNSKMHIVCLYDLKSILLKLDLCTCSLFSIGFFLSLRPKTRGSGEPVSHPMGKKCFKSLLLWNQSANLKQTWHGWSLGSILSKLCPVTTTSIHDGCHEQT
jgi:hypothetical protein